MGQGEPLAEVLWNAAAMEGWLINAGAAGLCKGTGGAAWLCDWQIFSFAEGGPTVGAGGGD